MQPGSIGAIVGTAIGILGSIVGTYFSIKNANGPREQAFVIKALVMLWGALTTFLCALLLLPSPYNHLMWIPYGIILSFGIRKFNESRKRLRENEINVDS